MALDWNNIDRSSKLIDTYFFYPFYNRLSALATERPMIRLAALVIGTVDGAASLAQAAGGVGEAAIKGVANLLKGASTCNTESLKRGSLQLAVGAGVIGVLSIPITIIRTLRITGGVLIDLKETSEKQAANYRRKVQVPTAVVATPSI